MLKKTIGLLREKKKRKIDDKKLLRDLRFMFMHIYAQIRIILLCLLILINWITATNWNEDYLFSGFYMSRHYVICWNEYKLKPRHNHISVFKYVWKIRYSF